MLGGRIASTVKMMRTQDISMTSTVSTTILGANVFLKRIEPITRFSLICVNLNNVHVLLTVLMLGAECYVRPVIHCCDN